MDTAAIAQAVWEYSTRTLSAGSPGSPTTPAEDIAADIWVYSTRTLTDLPGEITDLEATAISASRIDLIWTPASGATSHRIERATVG